MYVTQHRLVRRALGYKQGATINGYTSLESVYSFRTGRGLKGHTSTSFVPSGANLASKLAARKEFLEGIDRSFSGERAPIEYSQGRTNAFIRSRHLNWGRAKYWNKGVLLSDVPVLYAPVRPADFPCTGNGATDNQVQTKVGTSGLLVGPNRAAIQNYGSQMHASSNPLRAQLGIGETLAELASGNLPKLVPNLLKNFDSLLAALKRAPKNAGQDYLNSQFGIGPILDDLYTLLLQGVVAYEGLYNVSYRRRRRTPLEITYNGGLSTAKSASVRRIVPNGLYVKTANGVVGTDFGFGGVTDSEPQVIVTQDHRFTARFTLARDLSGVGNYDRALELVRSYGLWTPSLLWDLTPWSWLVDWFLHLGRGINNAYDFSQGGRMHSDYACVTTRVVASISHPGGARSDSYGLTNLTSRNGSITDTLIRVPVNPFGSFVEVNSLSTWQKSILLSLGLAKTTR